METKTSRCSCCGLLQTLVSERGHCPTCRFHQSDEIHQTVKRHQDHESMLRERLAAASKWAEGETAARKAAGEKMHYALRSRDRTIKVLRQISDMHELRSDGSCKCRVPKNCRIAHLLSDRGVQQLVRRVDDYEDEMRERQRLIRELEASGDPYALDDLLRELEGPARQSRPGSA